VKGKSPILPGATLGVLGGGQLGRMFVHAAQQLGYAVAVLDPDPDSPAGQVAQRHVRTGYLDAAGLAELAGAAAAVTTEFENVPAEALATLGRQRPVAPRAESVAVCQHRAAEKEQFARCGVAAAPHAVIESAAQLEGIDEALLPGILKTSSSGYDGKGQARVATRDELRAAWSRLGGVPCVLEQRLALAGEVSVVVARSAAGDCVHFPVQRNLHRDGILAVTEVPARGVPEALQRDAVAAAERIAEALGYVGVLCVEFFVLDDGRLVANEMAPRPHNSGHYTIDACDVSQFELQVRTLAGLPLVAPRLHSPAVMLNLLGDLWFRAGATEPRLPPWDAVLALPGVHLHLYGKAEARRGRKMGHLTVTAASADAAHASALQAAALLGIEPF
jgi:5-(carboxyamino)imidazole ribonucleotide synthase